MKLYRTDSESMMAPTDAFLYIRGLKTLPL